ncbi:MAG TPA: tyrosinase family protein, partial [Thermoleophilaceae bacterium]
WHGVPLGLCVHHEPLFLPWHRGYLYFFELALQDVDDQVTLPWWDWLNESDVPPAYSEAEVGGAPNLLASMPIKPFSQAPQPDWPQQTDRSLGGNPGPGPAPIPPPLNAFQPQPNLNSEQWVMAAPSYAEVSRRLEALHDNVHVWVGETMSDPAWAAYDPLFWAHHTMVDRLWRIWQHHHAGVDPPANLLDDGMTFAQPPALTPRDVLDVKQLGYEYAGLSSSVEGTL